jgi:RNA polymerase sigma-70 factor (ECF subfamily)
MSQFRTTRWSLFAAAREPSPGARAALEELCQAYRPPVLAYLRRSGYPDAEDLTQAFFLGILERGWYAGADPDRGRFRSLLLTSLRRFVADQQARAHAGKRSAPRVDAEALTGIPDDAPGPEEAFTQAWLQTVVARANERLEAEWARHGKQAQYAMLAPLLVERADGQELRALAERTGIRGNTLAVQAHRMRQRLRHLVRLELLATVGSPDDLEDELTELRRALAEHAG